MRNAPSNDNDTWQTLAAPTARVVSKLEKDKKNCEGDGDADAEHRREDEERERREYVERRLRDLAKFEALYRDAMKRG
jgi:hypothetical protein